MRFKVVNTIRLPGTDFGDHLLEPLGACAGSPMGRTEVAFI